MLRVVGGIIDEKREEPRGVADRKRAGRDVDERLKNCPKLSKIKSNGSGQDEKPYKTNIK